MTRQILSLLGATIALTACTVADPTVVTRLGADPVVSGGTYSSGGGVSIAVDARENNGKTMLCGVWAQSRAQSVLTKRVEPKLLGSASVSFGDSVLARGLLFMPEVDPAPDYAGQEARCLVTERAWQAGDDTRRPQIHIPGQVVHVESDDIGTFAVTFRQTGPGAGET